MFRLREACLAIFVMAFSTGLFPAEAAVPTARESILINGRSYVRVAVWARTANFQVRWLQPDRVLQLASKSSTIVLQVDSREAKINGTTVWLCFPAIPKNGGVYVSLTDIQSTFNPVLYPPRYRPGQKVRTICIDPGHGGKDPGNRAYGRDEKTAVLLLGHELRKQLTTAGFKVIMTRADDTYVELPDRPVIAARRGADVLLSLHYNGGAPGNRTALGVETYSITPPGAASTNADGDGPTLNRYPGNRRNDFNVLLAYHVQRSLLRNLGSEDRGMRRARFAVLRDATMPAVLVEAGFMSHPTEGRKLFETAHRQKVAKALKEAMLAYKKAIE